MTADQHFQTCAYEMGLDFNGEIKIGGNYSPVVRDGKQLWVSGQIPRVGDEVLFVGVLGPRGVHARTSVGVMQLPKGAAVELDMVATAKAGQT